MQLKTRALTITLLVLVGVCPFLELHAQDRSNMARGLQFGRPRELLEKLELNALSDIAFGPDGGVFVLDLSNYQVVALDSAGQMRWRVGRRGQGPGEFTLPYRLARRPEGGVAVLDWGTGRVTLLSAMGKVDASMQLPFSFTQIDGMAILPDGRYLIAAATHSGGSGASDRSLHLFNDSLLYRSSFAPFAVALDTAAVRYVGSGGFTLDKKGQVLFTPKRPYEIQRYSIDGRLLERVPVGAQLQHDLGDFISVQHSGTQTFKSTTAKTRFVEMPAPVRELAGGGFIGGRGTFERTTVDLISSTGVLEASVMSPGGCGTILGIDTDRNLVYCKALVQDVPALLRVPFTITSPGRKP